jgi:hypothetical protein
MDLRWFFLLFLASSFVGVENVSGNMVFPVHHKFKGKERSLSALKAHDARRHGRFLFDVDLELGGNGQPSETGSVSFFKLCVFFILFFSFCLCFEAKLAGIGVSWSLIGFFLFFS